MPRIQVPGLYGRGRQKDKFLYRQGIEGLRQCDRMIRSGSMRKGVFHKQHDNRYKNRAPSPRNKPFEFFNFYFHFFSFESFTTVVLTAVTGREWCNSDAKELRAIVTFPGIPPQAYKASWLENESPEGGERMEKKNIEPFQAKKAKQDSKRKAV